MFPTGQCLRITVRNSSYAVRDSSYVDQSSYFKTLLICRKYCLQFTGNSNSHSTAVLFISNSIVLVVVLIMRSVKSKRNVIVSEASSDGNEFIHSRRREIYRILSSCNCENDNEIEYNGHGSNIKDMLQELVLEEEMEIRNGDHPRLDSIEWKAFSGEQKSFAFTCKN